MLMLASPVVVIDSIREGVASVTWREETFAFAENSDEKSNRYAGVMVNVSADGFFGLVVKPAGGRMGSGWCMVHPPATGTHCIHEFQTSESSPLKCQAMATTATCTKPIDVREDCRRGPFQVDARAATHHPRTHVSAYRTSIGLTLSFGPQTLDYRLGTTAHAAG